MSDRLGAARRLRFADGPLSKAHAMTSNGTVRGGARIAALAGAVFDTASDGLIGQDADGAITSWNTSAERIFGTTSGEVMGTSFARFLDNRGAERWRELLERVRAGERVSLATATLRREGGLIVNASLHLSPLHDADGEFLGSALVVHDRTEEVIAQQTLAAGEEQVRRSEALASAGSFVIDGGDFSEQWSDGMHRIYGVSPEDFEGTRAAHLELVHPGDRAAVAELMAAALERGVPAELDHRLASLDGATWVFLAVEPVVDQFGRTTGISGICQDVSVRKEAEAAVREALAVEQKVSEELRQLDALKDDFLATVSHELRTPLTSIGGYASLLAKKHPELSELIGPIERNSTEMSRMIETLLDFCRLTAGQVVLHRAPVALATLIDDCVPQSTSPAPEFRNEVPADLTVLSDADALCRIIGNLLGNAARYAGSGSTVTVSASVEPSGATVISVADDGPGIAPIHLARLFERFYQVPGKAARRGTGIGLAIVHEYVTKLGGTVWCESTEGVGATFLVRLP
jgi:PAS domain S-box-containing protein